MTAPPAPRRVWCLVQGSEGLSAQQYLGNHIDISWLLWAAGTPPADVQLYIYPLSGPDRFPSPGPGLPPRRLPPGYDACVVRLTDGLRQAVRTGMAAFFFSTATDMTFIYVDHGGPKAHGDKHWIFDVKDFSDWARDAVLSGKHLLFVLDACESSQLAAAVWLAAPKELDPTRAQSLPAFVGFLTSGLEPRLSSAILVSAEADLVYLCDNGRKRGANALEIGYRIRNSMFSRQLLRLWGTGRLNWQGSSSRISPP